MFDDEITKTLQIKADFVVSFEHSRAALCAGNLLKKYGDNEDRDPRLARIKCK